MSRGRAMSSLPLGDKPISIAVKYAEVMGWAIEFSPGDLAVPVSVQALHKGASGRTVRGSS